MESTVVEQPNPLGNVPVARKSSSGREAEGRGDPSGVQAMRSGMRFVRVPLETRRSERMTVAAYQMGKLGSRACGPGRCGEWDAVGGGSARIGCDLMLQVAR